VCTSSYVFDLSLSRVLDMVRSWCIACFVNIVGSYGISSLSIFVVMNWVFTFEVSLLSDWIFRFENTWCMSCIWIPVLTMGYYIDSLDVCFGTQLADSWGDIGVIYA
jgi:hypothetical protein